MSLWEYFNSVNSYERDRLKIIFSYCLLFTTCSYAGLALRTSLILITAISTHEKPLFYSSTVFFYLHCWIILSPLFSHLLLGPRRTDCQLQRTNPNSPHIPRKEPLFVFVFGARYLYYHSNVFWLWTCGLVECRPQYVIQILCFVPLQLDG